MHCQPQPRLAAPGRAKAGRRRYKTFMIDEILSKETCDYFEKLSLYSVCPSLLVRPKPLHSCAGKAALRGGGLGEGRGPWGARPVRPGGPGGGWRGTPTPSSPHPVQCPAPRDPHPIQPLGTPTPSCPAGGFAAAALLLPGRGVPALGRQGPPSARAGLSRDAPGMGAAGGQRPKPPGCALSAAVLARGSSLPALRLQREGRELAAGEKRLPWLFLSPRFSFPLKEVGLFLGVEALLLGSGPGACNHSSALCTSCVHNTSTGATGAWPRALLNFTIGLV